MARNIDYSKRYKTNKYLLLKIASIVIAVAVVVFILLQFVFCVSVVSGSSMYPTYKDGQLIIYNRLDKDLSHGDVIGMDHLNGDFYVKRVIAMGGDIVDIRDGKVYVNDQLSDYGFGDTVIADSGNVKYPYEVSEGSVFVMGDNRGINPETGGLYSVDSRTFGEVSLAQILGTVF